jgi:tetratricopeptide (TPR) repeat protein
VAGQASFWVPSGEVLPQEEVTDYLANRGLLRLVQKDYDHAIADFSEVLRINPKDAWAHYDRARCWQRKRDFAKAIADFNDAVQLNPRSAAAYNGRAWIWATCADVKFRDGPRAIESARRACELTSGSSKATCLDTLAAAYAEAGNFAEAVKAQTKANDLFASDGRRKRGLARLNLYREKKAYRE